MWKVATTHEFDEWFVGLENDAKVEIIAKVKLLEILGPQLGRPHADTLNASKHSNLKELRADTKDKVVRIAFAFDPNRAAILLWGGNKAGVSQKCSVSTLPKFGACSVARPPASVYMMRDGNLQITTEGAVEACPLALPLLPTYASRYSRHAFTQPQLFACLVLREHQKKSSAASRRYSPTAPPGWQTSA